MPDVADGEETDDELDEDEGDDEDEDPLAGVAAVELPAPAVAAARCAEAGRATVIAAAVAALSTPAPAVTAASLVLPRRRFRWAVASSASSDSCSVVMVASRFIAQIGWWLIQARRAGSMAHARRLGGSYEISPWSGRQQNSRRNHELNLRRPGAYPIAQARPEACMLVTSLRLQTISYIAVADVGAPELMSATRRYPRSGRER